MFSDFEENTATTKRNPKTKKFEGFHHVAILMAREGTFLSKTFGKQIAGTLCRKRKITKMFSCANCLTELEKKFTF